LRHASHPLLFSVGQKCTEQGSIKRVTKAKAGNFETVTFEVNSANPDYSVETSRPPFTLGESDKTIHIRGKYFKSVNFKSVVWTCRIAESLSTPTVTIMDVRNTEQFEGYVTYVIGYRTKSKYVGTTKITTGDKTKIAVKFRR
jgi:hypothetical protein